MNAFNIHQRPLPPPSPVLSPPSPVPLLPASAGPLRGLGEVLGQLGLRACVRVRMGGQDYACVRVFVQPGEYGDKQADHFHDFDDFDDFK